MAWIVEDMALSDDNQQWVRDRIAEAVNPNGWIKLAHWLRFWSLPGTLVTVFVGLLAIIATLATGVTNRRETEATFRGTTEEKLKGIDRQLVDLRALVASSRPNRLQNQQAAKQLLAEVKNKLIPPIPAQTAEQTGKSFIDASENDPRAWDVALAYASYRSSLNQSTISQYHWMQISAKPNPSPKDLLSVYITAETVPCTQGAMQAHVGSGGRIIVFNAEQSGACAAYLRFVGGEWAMDGNYYINTIFENTRITYRGGPYTLDNVTFVNCTFDFPQPTPETIRLASAVLLESTQVTLKSPKG